MLRFSIKLSIIKFHVILSIKKFFINVDSIISALLKSQYNGGDVGYILTFKDFDKGTRWCQPGIG